MPYCLRTPLAKQWITLALGVLLSMGEAAAGDFRIENTVYVGKSDKPVVRSTTIFHQGAVYDFMAEPAEVVVFDKQAGRFTLLDISRRVRTEMTTDQVAQFTAQLKKSAGGQTDPFAKFLAAPTFDEQFEKAPRRLTLSSPWMTYRMELAEPGSKAIAEQYRQFSDWYARLNSLLNPQSRPPFARLLVNAALAKHEATAREVHLTLVPKKSFPPKRITIRSEHELVQQVVGADLDRVAQAREFMEIFKPISFQQYRKGDRP